MAKRLGEENIIDILVEEDATDVWSVEVKERENGIPETVCVNRTMINHETDDFSTVEEGCITLY